MLKFVKGHLESMEGIALYPILSLVLFSLFFILLFARVCLYKKEQLDFLKQIPFKDN
jgi:hypothetical protein